MAYLLDTNVLARLANVADAQHAVAAHTVIELHRRGELLHITPQVLIEFRSLATRPAALNGLGLPAVDTETQAAGFEASFPLLPDTPAIYPAWKTLVTALGIVGKQVHDTRLIAVCHAHAVTHLLTSNVSDFSRMSTPAPGVAIIDPSSV
jgi:predicted nucleic acid-binding protein